MVTEMHEDNQPDDFVLLSLSSLLIWFDHDLLLALSKCSAATVSAFLGSDYVSPAVHPPATYVLRGDVQGDAVAQLRRAWPGGEVLLHTRAFTYFLGVMQESAPLDTTAAFAEAACLHHLHKLYPLLIDDRELQTLAEYVAAVTARHPRELCHLQQLALYEGSIAIRRHAYAQGETILLDLLAQPGLPNDIRMKALNLLGQSKWFQSRFDRALAFYQQLSAFAHEVGDRYNQGCALLNMGIVYKELGAYDRAITLSMHSLELFRAQRETRLEAHALYEIGNSAMQLGRWESAQHHFEQAIALYEQLGSAAHLANLYWCQGYLFHMQGNERRSEAAYLRSLAISESAEHGDDAVTMDNLLYLGLLYQTEERWELALRHYDRAAHIAQRLHNQHTLALVHYRRSTVFRQLGDRVVALQTCRQAIEEIEALRNQTDGEEIKIAFLGTTQQVYELAVLLCLECEQPDEAFHFVERARSRAFLDMLVHKAPDLYNAVAQPVVTLADVQNTLPFDALLVEYFTIGVVPRGENLITSLLQANARLRAQLTFPPQVLIFAVAHDRFELHRAELDPNTLRPQQYDSGPGQRLLWNAQLPPLLYRRLIEPVLHLVYGKALLFLIPHGPLHYVPFMALRSAAGDYLLRRDGPAITLAPSATILVRNCLGRAQRQDGTIMAFGYNGSGDQLLRYAETEARMAAVLLEGQAWTGSQPKSNQLIAVGKSARWVHFAGHARYRPHEPLESALLLGDDDELSARQIIGGLELSADMVILSACTSGLSHVVPGDELLGLPRAFLYAGVPTVLCTLWEADDLLALLVMEQLYTKLREGQSAAMALRDTQISLREMTGRDANATFARWRRDYPAFAAQLVDLPLIPDDQADHQLYADPNLWAPFMVIGRP